MEYNIIARFQVAVRVLGAFNQELIIMSMVVIREDESYILDDDNRDKILLNRAIANIKDFAKAGTQHGDIISLPID